MLPVTEKYAVKARMPCFPTFVIKSSRHGPVEVGHPEPGGLFQVVIFITISESPVSLRPPATPLDACVCRRSHLGLASWTLSGSLSLIFPSDL